MIRRKKRQPTSAASAGLPLSMPLGAQVVPDGVRFTLFSRHATRVWLMLFDQADADKPTREYKLLGETNRTGDIWHIHVPDARAGQFYLYRMEGQPPAGIENPYNPKQWLLDPYAHAVAGAPEWGDAFDIKPGRFPHHGGHFPKGVILQDDYDWSGDVKPGIPLSESIIYEAHTRGYTAHESSGVKYPGT